MDTYFKELDEHAKQYGKDKSILFMQVGSFYESYQSDKQGFDLDIISDITNCLISRKDKTAPVSKENVKTLGFPLNSLNKYLSLLIESGYQVKIIEQNAIGKIHGRINPVNNGKIERTTKGVYSSGTVIDLDSKDNNFIKLDWENQNFKCIKNIL